MSAQYSPLSATFKRLTIKAIFTFCLSLLIFSNSLADRTYGPVKAKDFLSKIVNKSYPASSLTKSQIMVAILRSNPDAFRGGNIHFLKQAVILKLPAESDIATLSADEASSLVAEHLVFFKQGKTGDFVHKAWVTSQNDSENTNPAEDTNQAATSSQTKAEEASESVPTKVKIEIRKQQQLQGNKLKQVKSLEKISTQQNKTLTSLDDQILLLEEQLKLDNERKKKEKNKAATESQPETANDSPEPPVEQTNPDDEDSTAENAISSLESVLSTSTPKPEEKIEPTPKVTEPTASIEEKPEVEQPEAEVQPEVAKPSVSHSIESSTESSESEKTELETTVQAALVQEETETLPKTNTVESSKAAAEPQENKISSDVSTPSETPSKATISSPLEDPKTIAWLISILLGLVALGYFLLGRKAPQKPVATPVPFEKSSYNESADKLSKMPSQENILNPVIKASSSKSVHTSSSSEASSKTNEEDSEIKINMARAYMDMGYIDAAKESLEEVQKEGTTEQKDTAQQMLSML